MFKRCCCVCVGCIKFVAQVLYLGYTASAVWRTSRATTIAPERGVGMTRLRGFDAHFVFITFPVVKTCDANCSLTQGCNSLTSVETNALQCEPDVVTCCSVVKNINPGFGNTNLVVAFRCPWSPRLSKALDLCFQTQAQSFVEQVLKCALCVRVTHSYS